MIKYYDVQSVLRMIGNDVQHFSGKRIIASGTSGFLGQWFLRVIGQLNESVLTKPCELTAIDINRPAEDLALWCEHRNIRFNQKDLTKRFVLDEAKFDFVVHMAGIASPAHYKRLPLETIQVSNEGSISLLEIARRSGARYLFCSSSEVYQTATQIPTPESFVGSIPSNTDRSCYDVSKLMGETLAYVYWKEFGLSTSIIRIFNSFGPGLSEADYRILPKIASSYFSGKSLAIYKGTGALPTRTYCPAANTIAGLFLALLKGEPGQIYNIGSDSPEINVVELIQRINSACGIEVSYRLVNPPDVYLHEPMRRSPNIDLARKELGYVPAVELDSGLRAFFSWASESYKR